MDTTIRAYWLSYQAAVTHRNSRSANYNTRIGAMLGFKDFVSAQITLAGVELLHRIRQGQFALRKLGVAKKTAPEIWNAVLAA